MKSIFDQEKPKEKIVDKMRPHFELEKVQLQNPNEKGTNGVATFFWVVALLGVVVGVLILVGGIGSANGAPQEAVVVSLSIACAVLPYCLARAISELTK